MKGRKPVFETTEKTETKRDKESDEDFGNESQFHQNEMKAMNVSLFLSLSFPSLCSHNPGTHACVFLSGNA